MVLVYTHKITPRLRFIMKQVFKRILGYELAITDSVDVFIKHTGAKLSYAKQPLQHEFFIRANHLLFERRLEPQDINWRNWNGIPCFFELDHRSSIPFDIFAASFYLLSRYEEYLPHQKDSLGRFRAIESILSDRFDAFNRPLVDLWAYQFRDLFSKHFPDESYQPRSFEFFVGVPVVQSHAYLFRGLARHLFEISQDGFSGKFSQIVHRLRVLFSSLTDPYDNYLSLARALEQLGVDFRFFFQFAPYHVRDRNVSWNRPGFGYFLKHIADYTEIGYYRSRSALIDLNQFKVEKARLEQLLHRQTTKTCIAQNAVVLPDVYQELVGSEITEDYSMGYEEAIGFKAGTCTPFPFYDLGLELEQPLRIHPFVAATTIFEQENHDSLIAQLQKIKNQVASVEGKLYLQFNNRFIGAIGQDEFISLLKAIDG